MSGGDDPLASLHPAYFALVMATGIVSIAGGLLDLRPIAVPLLWLNCAFYAILWVLTVMRLARFRARFVADLTHHGSAGKGDGYGAPFLVPPPRDFTSGQFKFRTTASGLLPTDEDLFRTISRGADGTGMPPWQFLLSDNERWALVDYVKSYDARFAAASARLKPMPLPAAPGTSRSAGRGREVYAKMQCAKCHGEDGRGVGPSSPSMLDAVGRHVFGRYGDRAQPL